jgi:hypothetical protein
VVVLLACLCLLGFLLISTNNLIFRSENTRIFARVKISIFGMYTLN